MVKLKLSDAQKEMLNFLAQYPREWRNDMPGSDRIRKSLVAKGLVKHLWRNEGWIAMITKTGLEYARNVGKFDT